MSNLQSRVGRKMKSVLISIKPKWCKLIASGEKPLRSERQDRVLILRLSATYTKQKAKGEDFQA